MSALLNQIDELLEQYDEYSEQAFETQEQAEQAKPKFEVTDKSSAEWVVRKIAKLRAEQEENHTLAEEQMKPLKEELDQIYDWEEGEHKKLQNRIGFLESLLEPYHRKILEADPKAKTIKLPHGDLCIRKQQPDYQRDEKVLVSSLKELGLNLYIKTEETPKWGELKPLTAVQNGKVVHKETGTIISGITAIERPDKFEVVCK